MAPQEEMEIKIENLLKQLSLEEKIKLCHGCDSMSAGDIPRLGIGRATMADGPQGVRLEDGRTTTALPCGIALACSFDVELAEKYGALIAQECLANDIQVSLGPGFNLMRTPLNGRNFEYFGEDPVLAGEIAAGYIRGCQSYDVAACPKHIALNNQEKCRTVTDAIIEERPLRELYLRAFEIVVKKSNPWMMMSALNAVNGVRGAHNYQLQQQIAKDEFGFDGVMVSDWGAAKETKAAALGGLDLDMGHGDNPVLGGSALKQLVESGEVPEAVIDDKARRVLRLLFRTKVFDPAAREKGECNSVSQRKLARRIAIESMVLLKNENGMLPLARKKYRKIAVIGPNAATHHSMGSLLNCGGSGAVHPDYEHTPLDGLRALLGNEAEIAYTPGIIFETERRIPPEIMPEGFKAEYFRLGEDQPFMTRIDHSMNQQWGNLFAAGREVSEIDLMLFKVRWTGKIVPKESGPVKLIAHGARARSHIYLDGQEIIAPNHTVLWRPFVGDYSFDAVAGHSYDVCIELERVSTEFTEFKLLWVQNPQPEFDHALKLAADADLVLFFGGSNHQFDREAVGGDFVPDADIPDLELPGNQSELIRRLVEVNPNIVVSLINGSALNVEPWIDNVPALLECWYPGMEGGNAIAQVLFGEVTPGGKLCFSWGKHLSDYACHGNGNYPGYCGKDHPHVRYDEGIFIGYRHFDRAGIEPRFPFGFGLSYTTFKNELLDISQHGTNVKIRVTVTNTGTFPGAEVIQLYVNDPVCSEVRPLKELQSFKKVFLDPGERQEVVLELSWRDFAFFSEKHHQFIVESGDFELLLGTSAKNVFARRMINIASFSLKKDMNCK